MSEELESKLKGSTPKVVPCAYALTHCNVTETKPQTVQTMLRKFLMNFKSREGLWLNADDLVYYEINGTEVKMVFYAQESPIKNKLLISDGPRTEGKELFDTLVGNLREVDTAQSTLCSLVLDENSARNICELLNTPWDKIYNESRRAKIRITDTVRDVSTDLTVSWSPKYVLAGKRKFTLNVKLEGHIPGVVGYFGKIAQPKESGRHSFPLRIKTLNFYVFGKKYAVDDPKQ